MQSSDTELSDIDVRLVAPETRYEIIDGQVVQVPADAERGTAHARFTARDVFVDNPVFLLPRSPYRRIAELAGAIWVRDRTAGASHLDALADACAVLRPAFPHHERWLLGCHSDAQDDSAVTRHRRLWKSLEASKITIPRGPRTDEMHVLHGDGVRWFGAIRVGDDDLGATMNVIDAEPASVLVAVPPLASGEIETVIAAGWTFPDQMPPPEVLEWVSSRDGVAFWPVGRFDDPDVGSLLSPPRTWSR